jgi:hypothetical protein
MDNCARAMYTAQGEMMCLDSSEMFADPTCTICAPGMQVVGGTGTCYPEGTKNLKAMNTCMAKLAPAPKPTGYTPTDKNTMNLYMKDIDRITKACTAQFWKPTPKGATPAACAKPM